MMMFGNQKQEETLQKIRSKTATRVILLAINALNILHGLLDGYSGTQSVELALSDMIIVRSKNRSSICKERFNSRINSAFFCWQPTNHIKSIKGRSKSSSQKNNKNTVPIGKMYKKPTTGLLKS
jgi:hypothetical protein